MIDTGFEAPMRRALELAARGPAAGVNPRVGCVILSPTGETIAEGWHRGAGTAHAEVDALSKLAPGEAAEATAVVSLEPCNHTGRTGPCSEALIAAGVARVVYAVDDPGHASHGGADRLREAGVEVIPGVEAEAAGDFLSDWLTAARLGRPYVTLKWASSLDGRTAAADGSSRWITGAAARRRVHDDRAASDAIIVATGTVLADDPSLTARDEAGGLLAHQPLPVVIGDREVPQDAAVRRHPNPPLFLPGHDLAAALVDLRDRGVRTAYVEAGPVLSDALLRAGLVDELHVYLAPTLLGGPRTATTDLGVGTIAQQRRLRLQRVERVDDDVLLVALDPTARHLNPWPPDSTVAGTTPAGTTPADSTQTSQTIQQGA
ncbi:bifunctional diaminohydroxyphosphoribosylaminopyrimidine deaminase/5-amino-6-(5-phosphoribosylamino)uracil reductase RibD [Humibacter sp.]|jgi:diaminohydroxyphosphoribosylaminopyrimidine deaminase/5-amino-6-(5-phosphoribosylamino)uracil reductase|uniref:bifunctional diaminohydroxyphosphoribosylaminopyrimidine deaminase/5-amino-6-(5-phosphoribosylamino)uracil reductase RibD n=1 Tax=Humibacter sp. TaxID=1940291 RepID=UPI002BC29524|nr:bifunctional diaminohydroxyphosphoribosylaminopyrimidine deaminase/5-amino-6-(5-phosphoribosylamino)uracil reductase RibD [Humibacter sp.]HVX09429.1 bifunctional diaminohydroxyphosphoribosylaminopyrimidine deaminase/5-amino-6-(5-phosphoribosylamino)uracil reductase RibD [Humibacter sp.]